MKWENSSSKALLQKLADKVTEDTENEAAKLTFEVISKNDIVGIKKAASKFLDSLLKVQNLENLSSTSQFIDSVMSKDDAYRYFQILKNNLSTALAQKKLREEALEFQVQLNAFMGREIYLTVVDRAGRLWVHSAASEYELLKGKKADGNRLNKITNVKTKNLTSRTKATTKLDIKDIQELLNKKIDNLVSTYQMVVKRYDPKTIIGGKTVPSIYYHNNSKRRKPYLPLSSLGIAGEAYVAALFQTGEKDSNFVNNFHYDEPGIAYFYKRYCMDTDTRAGAVIGDIGNKPTDSVQLAVKAVGGASSGSYLPFVDVAKEILAMENPTAQKISNYFKKQESLHNNIYTNAVQISEKVVQEEALGDLEEILERVGSPSVEIPIK